MATTATIRIAENKDTKFHKSLIFLNNITSIDNIIYAISHFAKFMAKKLPDLDRRDEPDEIASTLTRLAAASGSRWLTLRPDGEWEDADYTAFYYPWSGTLDIFENQKFLKTITIQVGVTESILGEKPVIENELMETIITNDFPDSLEAVFGHGGGRYYFHHTPTKTNGETLDMVLDHWGVDDAQILYRNGAEVEITHDDYDKVATIECRGAGEFDLSVIDVTFYNQVAETVAGNIAVVVNAHNPNFDPNDYGIYGRKPKKPKKPTTKQKLAEGLC